MSSRVYSLLLKRYHLLTLYILIRVIKPVVVSKPPTCVLVSSDTNTFIPTLDVLIQFALVHVC